MIIIINIIKMIITTWWLVVYEMEYRLIDYTRYRCLMAIDYVGHCYVTDMSDSMESLPSRGAS